MNPNTYSIYKQICGAVTKTGVGFTRFTNNTLIGRSI